jgi:moderate conductance mechanosensitive channel
VPVTLFFFDILQRVARFLGVSPDQVTSVLVEKTGKLVFIWVGAWIVYRLVKLLAARIVASVDDGDDAVMTAAEKRGHTIATLVRSTGRILVIFMAALLSLAEFINIGPLLAGAGVFGLAVSFGAQSLVKDVISGFFLLIENGFAVGDVIEAAGKTGVVERITLRVVYLRDLRGVLHIVRNGQIETVSNFTNGWSRAVVEVDVAYGADVDQALAVFKDEATKLADDLAWNGQLDGPPEVSGIENLGESGVTIRTLIRTAPGQHWTVAREFRRRIKKRLDAEGIEIPFPQRTIHIRPADLEPAARPIASKDG